MLSSLLLHRPRIPRTETRLLTRERVRDLHALELVDLDQLMRLVTHAGLAGHAVGTLVVLLHVERTGTAHQLENPAVTGRQLREVGSVAHVQFLAHIEASFLVIGFSRTGEAMTHPPNRVRFRVVRSARRAGHPRTLRPESHPNHPHNELGLFRSSERQPVLSHPGSGTVEPRPSSTAGWRTRTNPVLPTLQLQQSLLETPPINWMLRQYCIRK